MADTSYLDESFLRMEPEWGKATTENLKLIHSLGDEERKKRIERILTISLRQKLKDSLLNNQPMLAPSTREKCLGNGDVFLGNVSYGQTGSGNDRILYSLYLNLEDIQNHVVLTGSSGVGKTTLAYNIVIELARKGQKVIIMDWNRTWRNFLSLNPQKHPFVKDLRIFTLGRNIAPFSHNLFFAPPEGVSFENWMGIISAKPLQKSMLSGMGSEHLLTSQAEDLMNAYRQGKLKMLPNIEDMKIRLEKSFHQGRAGLWQQSALRVLAELCRPAVKEVFSSRNPTNIGSEILDSPNIVIFEMDIEFPVHLRILFQETFLNYVLLHFMHKGETEELRLTLVMEEFQNMLPVSWQERQVGGEIIKNLFREGRKLGIGTISICQEPSELGNYILANAKTQLHFTSTTKKDCDTVSSGLFLKPHETRYLDYIWKGQCFAKIKGRIRNCMIKTPPPPFREKITDQQLKRFSQKWNAQK